MRLSRLLLLTLTMVVAVAWVGLSVGASFHYHDHGLVHHDCPWCSVANFQIVLTDFNFNDCTDSGVSSSLFIVQTIDFASADLLGTRAPRAPPFS